jgi:hypothetical protein
VEGTSRWFQSMRTLFPFERDFDFTSTTHLSEAGYTRVTLRHGTGESSSCSRSTTEMLTISQRDVLHNSRPSKQHSPAHAAPPCLLSAVPRSPRPRGSPAPAPCPPPPARTRRTLGRPGCVCRHSPAPAARPYTRTPTARPRWVKHAGSSVHCALQYPPPGLRTRRVEA